MSLLQIAWHTRQHQSKVTENFGMSCIFMLKANTEVSLHEDERWKGVTAFHPSAERLAQPYLPNGTGQSLNSAPSCFI